MSARDPQFVAWCQRKRNEAGMIGLLDGRLIAHAFAPLRKVARPSPAVCPHGDALRICGDCAREQREATA